MESLWQWGIAFIVAVQSTGGERLDAVFRAISFLGEEQFYLVFFPLLLWCVDARLGFRLGVIFLLSVYTNYVVQCRSFTARLQVAMCAHNGPFLVVHSM